MQPRRAAFGSLSTAVVNRRLNGLARGYHPHIHLPFPSQPDTGNLARAEIDYPRLFRGM
jgi:hypothetical protein